MSRFDLSDPAQDTALEPIRRLRRTVILQITALGLAALALPLYMVFTQLRAESVELATELASIQASTEALSAPLPQVEALTAKAAEIITLTTSLEAVPPPAGVNWPAVITAIKTYDRGQIELTTLTQTDNRILLEGRATNNEAVVAYVEQLSMSPWLVNVDVQSIKLTDNFMRAAAARRGEPTTIFVSARAQPAEPTPEPTPNPHPAQFVLVLTVKL